MAGDVGAGRLLTLTAQMQAGGGRPAWVGVAEAVERMKTAGGELLSGPHQAPGGNWVAQGRDTEGALFALTSLKA